MSSTLLIGLGVVASIAAAHALKNRHIRKAKKNRSIAQLLEIVADWDIYTKHLGEDVVCKYRMLGNNDKIIYDRGDYRFVAEDMPFPIMRLENPVEIDTKHADFAEQIKKNAGDWGEGLIVNYKTQGDKIFMYFSVNPPIVWRSTHPEYLLRGYFDFFIDIHTNIQHAYVKYTNELRMIAATENSN